MAIENLIEPNAFAFPENATLDLHDIVTILFRERLLSDTRFRRARLIEVSDGSWPASSVPIDNQRAFVDSQAPKVGYFLKLLGESKDGNDDDDVIEPHNFLHEHLITPKELDVEEVEDIFWTVKNHDSGFVLHHALQLVLDSLPTSTTLRIRAYDGYSVSCTPQSFIVAEMDLLPRRFIFINAIHPRVKVDGKKQIPMDQYSFGEKWVTEPWIYFVFSENESKVELTNSKPNKDDDKAIILDINLSVLGSRGPGNEPFALTRRNFYHNELLPRAGVSEDLQLIHSPRIPISPTSNSKYQPAITLAKRILTRLQSITHGEETFCAYCGKKGARSRCSRCGPNGNISWNLKTRYCNAGCQKRAWPYHKAWCKIDAAATASISATKAEAEKAEAPEKAMEDEPGPASAAVAASAETAEIAVSNAMEVEVATRSTDDALESIPTPTPVSEPAPAESNARVSETAPIAQEGEKENGDNDVEMKD